MSEDRVSYDTTPGHLQRIPLGLLKVSPRNVRKTASGIDALAVSIAAHGLVHNLVAEKVNGHFEVIAGSRRLLALQQLQKTGKLPADLAEIRTLVVPAAGAAEISLAENSMREPMHPADQFEAFRALLDAGDAEADVAARFSVAPLFVRQRMKLANVSPKILDQYRAGKLDLQAVEAFALSDDHEQQERVLKSGGRHAYAIREALTKNEVPLSDKRIKAIGGVAAYEKAGGAVRRDLFAQREEGYAVDVKLVDKLVADKIEATAAKLRKEGWSFVDAGAGIEPYRYADAGGAKADKTKTGAVVYVDWNGEICSNRGVLKPGQRAGKKTATKGKPAKKPGDLAFSQVQLLQLARDGIVAEHLEQQPIKAIACLAAALLYAAAQQVDIKVDNMVDMVVGLGLSDDRPYSLKDASGARDKQFKAKVKVFIDQVPKGSSITAWMLTQPDPVVRKVLTLCAAIAVNSVEEYEHHRTDPGVEFATLVGAQLAGPPAPGWWPTGEWLEKQGTEYVLAAVKDACGKKAADELALTKGKAAIAGKAWKLLSDAGWMPVPLRPFQAKAPKAPAKKAAAKK